MSLHSGQQELLQFLGHSFCIFGCCVHLYTILKNFLIPGQISVPLWPRKSTFTGILHLFSPWHRSITFFVTSFAGSSHNVVVSRTGLGHVVLSSRP